ncbi:Flp pilus assembly protein CpaB [Alcanivorax sp. S6407]|uniref:Flp pilus assembly protein CpaB n=1 Tax=Alcanivorax sp. S6407 TaxID=2926424 RepID=UPI001FF3F5E4|nr:Flp pilus assembly protein CpaB [Alcanivorax sp. S6407]MCK0154643.1 Flp pilus assembly protein CpaB [Alcanivorax sp. S6407]
MGSRLLYMLPALVVALVALILAVVGLSRNPASSLAVAPEERSRAGEEQQAPAFRYWVVTESLNIGDELTDDSLAVVSSPAPIANVLTADKDVVGKPLRQFARPGELLSRNHLEPGGTLPGTLPSGYRALAVAVDDVVMAGGLVTPGDLVDVVVAFRKGDGERDNPAAMVLLSNVQVLAVKGAMAEAQSDQGREQQRRNNTVVLAVPGDKMAAVLLAEEEGALRLAVVASEDKSKTVGTQGKPVYYRDLFPGKAAPVRRATPGQRVEVYEGSDSRSTYVR